MAKEGKQGKRRTGKGAKDIFTATGQEAGPPALGRPRTLAAWRKVTVDFTDQELLFLDRLALKIRERTGAVVKRTGILRALVDALEASGVDLSDTRTEEEIKEAILVRLAE